MSAAPKNLTPFCSDCKHRHYPKRTGGKTCDDAEDDRGAIRWHDSIVARIEAERDALALAPTPATRTHLPEARASLAAPVTEEPERTRAGREE